MPGLSAHEVLVKLYEELKEMGEIRRNIKQTYPLAEESDEHRTDICYYTFDGVISNIDGKDCIFTYGKTDYRWKYLARVDEAVMYAKVDWNELLRLKQDRWAPTALKELTEKKDIRDLTEQQVSLITYHMLRRDRLVGSWEGELVIRDGIDTSRLAYIIKPIPPEFVLERKIFTSKLATWRGVPILLEKESRAEEIRDKGLEPIGYQQIMYKNEVVPFLATHVKNVLFYEPG